MKRAAVVAVAIVWFAVPGVAGFAVPAVAGARVLGAAPRFADGDGIHALSTLKLDSRLVALRVSSAALTGPANVRILLPAGYALHPRRHYPVLYLLHGTSGGAADWTTTGDAEPTTAGQPLIVVMPDIALGDDGGGWCTNWWGRGPQGRPRWETFHIDQLIPWVDRNLRTISSRDGRAIAGLSQGGFCSMSYAARHPDLFSTALSFSGAPDIAYDAVARALVTPIINATEIALDGVPANSMFGPRPTEEINWAAHDPTTLAGNLRGMNLLMYTGNGVRGPLDAGAPNAGAMVIEAGVQALTKLFHQRLESLHIASFYDDYGPGTHSWPYWARDLRQSIGRVMADFAHPPATPKQVSYTSADARYSAFGWQVSTHRRVREFSTLRGAGRSGFTLQGSGSARVMTPARYRAGARYAIRISSRTGVSTQRGRVDAHGRLEIEVPLGPSDTVQEYPLDGPPLGTTVYTTRVTITPTP
jgi:S-formylglutathione hydrolase FrmB